MDRQAYALMKTLKAFRDYILHSKVMAYAPHYFVKEILDQ